MRVDRIGCSARAYGSSEIKLFQVKTDNGDSRFDYVVGRTCIPYVTIQRGHEEEIPGRGTRSEGHRSERGSNVGL